MNGAIVAICVFHFLLYQSYTVFEYMYLNTFIIFRIFFKLSTYLKSILNIVMVTFVFENQILFKIQINYSTKFQ